jgi:hypothetical protein
MRKKHKSIAKACSENVIICLEATQEFDTDYVDTIIRFSIEKKIKIVEIIISNANLIKTIYLKINRQYQ